MELYCFIKSYQNLLNVTCCLLFEELRTTSVLKKLIQVSFIKITKNKDGSYFETKFEFKYKHYLLRM